MKDNVYVFSKIRYWDQWGWVSCAAKANCKLKHHRIKANISALASNMMTPGALIFPEQRNFVIKSQKSSIADSTHPSSLLTISLNLLWFSNKFFEHSPHTFKGGPIYIWHSMMVRFFSYKTSNVLCQALEI